MSTLMFGSLRLVKHTIYVQMPFNYAVKSHLACVHCLYRHRKDLMVGQRGKSSSAKPDFKLIAALRRWNEDNTRLFGPILENSPIIPLGQKKKKQKSKSKQASTLSKPLNESSNVQNNENVKAKTGRIVDKPGFIINSDDKWFESNHESKPQSVHVENLDEQTLSRIFSCEVTGSESESNTHIDPLRSRLQLHPLPALPTVTGILARTRSPQSQFFLNRWKAQMIAELGEEGFKKYQSDMLRGGINLHACIQQFLSGTALSEVQLQDDNKGHWTSIENILSQVTSIKELESRVTHPYLQYAGTYDCTAVYKDTFCLIDWKTSTKPKPLLSNTFDYPLQVAAYIGALNSDPSQEIKVKHGLVVVAYGGGEPAHAHLMSFDQCEYYWKQWLQRLHQYWTSILCPRQV